MRKTKKIGGNIKDVETVQQERPTFANLTYDSGFKIVFGTEGKSERLLMLLLNRVLGLKIVSVKYLPTERLGLTDEESKSFFDVYCKDSCGRRFLIEMQMWTHHYFHKRAVYYSSLSVQDQARVEKQTQKEQGRPWDYYFSPVYQISFLNFPNTIVETKEDGNNQYISHYVFRSRDTGRELGDETNIIFVDLQKFRKKFEECKDDCERWLYSIRNMHLLKDYPDGIKGTELEELYNEARLAAWPADVRTLYEKYLMNRNDYENILYERYGDGFNKGYADGIEQGIERGIEQGIEKGIEQGIEKGIEQGTRESIYKMYESGMDKNTIAYIMKFTVEKVDEMLKQHEDIHNH